MSVPLTQALGPMTRELRWLALIPACIAAWWVALFAGLFLHSVLLSFCPPEMTDSGIFCDAEWYPAAKRILICFGAALSAVFVVLTAAIVAPSHRILVSFIAFGVGAVVATVMAAQIGRYAELASALAAGILASFAVTLTVRRSQRKLGNPP